MSSSLKIGNLAKRTECPVETIRFYEQEGLLPAAARSSSNYRLYGDVHVERLQFIRRCRALDMTLDEIRSLLRFRDTPEDDCGEVNLLLDQHIERVSRRTAELQSLQRHRAAISWVILLAVAGALQRACSSFFLRTCCSSSP
jgi:Cd(II)/Pb(II)-responsive transcriptional regulator